MQLKNGLYLGKIGSKYTLHNEKKLIELKAESFEKAKKEAEKYKQK